MRLSTSSNAKNKLLLTCSVKLIILFLVLVIGLAIFQDFLFSKIQNTGFYLSESLLYNLFWFFFIPFSLIIFHLLKVLSPKNILARCLYGFGIGIVFSFLHITIFAQFFVSISSIVFDPPHRFSSIFNSLLSNQFYIAFLFYTIAPNVSLFFSSTNLKSSKLIVKYPETISLKTGSKITSIAVASIQAIYTDKPYSVVHTNEQKFLLNRSLKDFERELDSTVFLRVHRSAVVNKKFIKELNSRKNGDYDALLENGLCIRLSRHYRKNWSALLQ